MGAKRDCVLGRWSGRKGSGEDGWWLGGWGAADHVSQRREGIVDLTSMGEAQA